MASHVACTPVMLTLSGTPSKSGACQSCPSPATQLLWSADTLAAPGRIRVTSNSAAANRCHGQKKFHVYVWSC